MQWFMLCIVLLLPLFMLGIGRGWEKNPPGKINGVYGYRTRWSGKSQETWDYAQRRIARMWRIAGALLLIFSAAVLALCWMLEGDRFYILSGLIMLIQVVVMVGTIFPVEKGLREHFDEEGRRIR